MESNFYANLQYNNKMVGQDHSLFYYSKLMASPRLNFIFLLFSLIKYGTCFFGGTQTRFSSYLSTFHLDGFWFHKVVKIWGCGLGLSNHASFLSFDLLYIYILKPLECHHSESSGKEAGINHAFNLTYWPT